MTVSPRTLPSKTIHTLIEVGNSRVVVMPKPWVEGMNLHPGDKLEVIFDEDVIIRPVKRGEKK